MYAGDASVLPARFAESLGIAAEPLDSLGDRVAARRDERQSLGGESTRDDLAADQAALFVLEVDDLERMTQHEIMLMEQSGRPRSPRARRARRRTARRRERCRCAIR